MFGLRLELSKDESIRSATDVGLSWSPERRTEAMTEAWCI